MKQKNIFAIFFLVITAMFYFSPVLFVPFYASHDGEAHVARFAAYYKAYADGQFPARWAGDLNFGYGSPVFIFYYPLPGMLASIIHIFGISFESIFKILIFSGSVLSPVFFYLWIKKHIRIEAALLAGLLYGLAPYHFLNVYVRGDVAEVMAYVFAPLVFLFIDKVEKKVLSMPVIFSAVFYALLILSHNAVALMFSALLALYMLFRLSSQNYSRVFIFQYIGILVFGLGMSAFFWLPAIYESRYTNAAFFIGNMFKDHFPSFISLVYSPWGFGPDVNKLGGLSGQIGPLHVVLVLASILLLFKKLPLKSTIFFWSSIFITAVFLSTSISSAVWQSVPMLKLFQFPWRINGLSVFAAAVLGGYVLDKFYNKIIYLSVVGLLFVFSTGYTAIKGISAKDDSFYNNYKGTTYYHGQASTIWTAGDFSSFPKLPIEVIDGDGEIKNITRNSNKHTFTVNADRNIKVLDNTVYFPGWQVLFDGEKVPIEFQDINHRGLLTFDIPKGSHFVTVKFSESPVRAIADGISLFFAAIVVVRLALLVIKQNKQ